MKKTVILIFLFFFVLALFVFAENSAVAQKEEKLSLIKKSETLARENPEKAAASLKKFLNDENYDVRLAAAEKLIALGYTDDKLIFSLINIARHPDSFAKEMGDYYVCKKRAAGLIVKIGQKAVPILIRSLNDDDVNVRIFAAEILGTMGPKAKEAVPALVKTLKNNYSPARYSAEKALVSIGKSSVHAVAKLLQDPDDDTRLTAIDILGQIGPGAKEAVLGLIKCVNDNNPNVALAAVKSLRALKDASKPCVDAFIKALDSSASSVKIAAIEALGEMGPAAADAIPYLAKFSKEKQKVSSLGGHESIICRSSITAIRKIGGAKAVSALMEILKYDCAFIALWSAEELGILGTPAIPALVNMLKYDKTPSRGPACFALGQMGPKAKEAIPYLINTLGAGNGYITWKASWALSRIGPAAVPALISAAKTDKNKYARELALFALGTMKPLPPEALPAIIGALQNDPDAWVRYGAAETLGRTGVDTQDIISALVNALEDADDSVKTAAAQSLEKIGPKAKKAVPYLNKALRGKSPRARLASAKALIKIDKTQTKNIIPVLISTFKDAVMRKDVNIYTSAAEILGSLGPQAKEAVPCIEYELKNNPFLSASKTQGANTGWGSSNGRDKVEKSLKNIKESK